MNYSPGILSKVLKKLVNQSRPPDREMRDDSWLSVEPSDGGMPSSHAMSLGFIGMFAWFALNALPLVQLSLIAYTAVCLIYRVHAKLHTWNQVTVGLVVGCCNGAAWWHLCHGTMFHLERFNMLTWVSDHLLVNGLLPWHFLVVPAALGLLVVGSFERRISRWMKSPKHD